MSLTLGVGSRRRACSEAADPGVTSPTHAQGGWTECCRRKAPPQHAMNAILKGPGTCTWRPNRRLLRGDSPPEYGRALETRSVPSDRRNAWAHTETVFKICDKSPPQHTGYPVFVASVLQGLPSAAAAVFDN